MSRKGVFIPDITVEMFKKATLESVEEFMVSGQMEDIEIPERPHGEWIETDDGDEIYGAFNKCTNCGALVLSTHMSYCGNCGAEMGEWEVE